MPVMKQRSNTPLHQELMSQEHHTSNIVWLIECIHKMMGVQLSPWLTKTRALTRPAK